MAFRGKAVSWGSYVRFKPAAILMLATVIGIAGMGAQPALADPDPNADLPAAAPLDSLPPAPVVPESERDEKLGQDWADSNDVTWSTSGDITGFHILAARESDGYAWSTVATLRAIGVETDRWIGNSCLSTDGHTLAVIYGPRDFTNHEGAFNRGAYAALVNLTSGAVTDLGSGYSLAYFNPGCGVDGKIALSAFSEDFERTRVRVVDPSTGTVLEEVEARGQLTSATVSTNGIVAGAADSVVSLSPEGTVSTIAEVDGVPYDLRATEGGSIAFVTQDDSTATVSSLSDASGTTTPVALASGVPTKVTLTQASNGHIFATGSPTPATESLPEYLSLTESPARSTASSEGQLLLAPAVSSPAASSGAVPESGEAGDIQLDGVTPDTNTQLQFKIDLGVDDASQQAVEPEAGFNALGAYGPGSPTNPSESERSCAVPRNDPANQALQPKPRQVEWVVDQAVSGQLTLLRDANWKRLGMASYSPQTMFPRRALVGGGNIPAQIVLGVLAQESNLWQASVYTTPGVTGNPLVGNFYGNDRFGPEETFWDPNFKEADCGYGVGQITDGMRLAGRERDGETALPAAQQRAIALDYAANISKTIQMLGDKWNQTKQAGLTINDGNAMYLENWFFAVWAYNTGFYANKGDGTPWGVGWLNNPANPAYDQSRLPFLDGSPSDAAHPQYWPYPEKVMGFAAHSTDLFEDADHIVSAFRPAQWLATDGNEGVTNRFNVKPPINTFCKASNNCSPGTHQQPADPDEDPGPCLHRDAAGKYDLKCWYHGNATWKADCDSACGREFIRFDPGEYPYQPDAQSFLPNCTTNGLPSGSLVIDELPNGTTSKRPEVCPNTVASSGSFGFTFGSDGQGNYPSKMDLHQLGAGFDSHFYFAHSRSIQSAETYHGGSLNITGTWTLGQSLNSWARVMVHLPDHGAWAQDAMYSVNLGNGTIKNRSLLQRQGGNVWVSLGVFQFNGTPRVSLSNVTGKGIGVDDIAWDAIAIQPLAAKPTDIVVSMGDSFSSGEGASSLDGANYYLDSNTNGDDAQLRNGCHRSSEAWSRKASIGTVPTSVGARADSLDSTLDYHLIACSGAESEHILPAGGPRNALGEPNEGQWQEPTQIDKGYLDENTTLVTLSIGGNDAGFAKVIQNCILASTLPLLCKNTTIAGDSQPLGVATAQRTNVQIPASIGTILQQIQLRAPNARILLMGYPGLFETGSSCAGVKDGDREWLNQVTNDLNAGLASAATNANSSGHPVTFADPRGTFSGTNLCTPAGISSNTGVVFQRTESDGSLFSWPLAGPNFGSPVSQQSFHPNLIGTDLYAEVMMKALGDHNFTFSRISGADRYSGSVAISQAGFPDSGAGAPVVWVASGESFPDALSAGPAAAKQGGPLLLTTSNSLPSVVDTEIRRLHPAKIVLVGGTNTVNDTVRTALSNIAPTTRISGTDRYDASRKVATYAFGTSAPKAYVATGVDFPDAISAGAAASGLKVPLILVNGQGDSADSATTAALSALHTTSITVVGGPNSVTGGVVTSLSSVAPTTRVSGSDRYAASLAANQNIYSSARRVFIATGASYADALTGAPLAAIKGGPLFLVQPGCIPDGVLSRVRSLGATNVTIIGGPNSVADAVTLPTVC
ncbi:cell wall-binding repeat-containing protein [Herbiconiux liangxiaofengii]|uniref:cell wall-binding repeat-containing protein n=1 Tax=Herbiconiux liangxiaofengii TaxID=3342795 RepID=UPI0035B78A3F